MDSALIDLIRLASTVLTVLLLARVVLSWVAPRQGNPLVQFIHRVTEPLLAPVRRVLPAMGGFDFSPVVVLVGINIVESLLLRLVWNLG